MDEEMARRVCSLIAAVLTVDGEMSADELSFLKRIMEQCGLPTDTAIMPTYGEDVAHELAQLPDAIRHEVFGLVVLAAAADGKIVPGERQIVDLIAGQLGIGEEEIIARFKQALG